MQIRATLNTPAHVYLVLIDSQGKAVPLYPWNPGTRIDTTRFLPLPSVPPTATAGSPPGSDKGWSLDRNDGLETVLLLARRTPLEVDLAPLLANVPPTRLRHA